MRPKRLISLLVAVCMMITMLPLSAVTAFAEDTSSSTGTAIVDGCEYDYTINTKDGTATITKFRAPDDGSYDITIPTGFGRFPVTAIGENAFFNCSALKKVTIPQSVTHRRWGLSKFLTDGRHHSTRRHFHRQGSLF